MDSHFIPVCRSLQTIVDSGGSAASNISGSLSFFSVTNKHKIVQCYGEELHIISTGNFNTFCSFI